MCTLWFRLRLYSFPPDADWDPDQDSSPALINKAKLLVKPFLWLSQAVIGLFMHSESTSRGLCIDPKIWSLSPTSCSEHYIYPPSSIHQKLLFIHPFLLFLHLFYLFNFNFPFVICHFSFILLFHIFLFFSSPFFPIFSSNWHCPVFSNILSVEAPIPYTGGRRLRKMIKCIPAW